MRKSDENQIGALEMQLLVPDILLFRHLAAKSLKQQTRLQGLHSPLQHEGSAPEVSQHDAEASTAEVLGGSPQVPQDISVKEALPAEASTKKRKSLDAKSPSGASERYLHLWRIKCMLETIAVQVWSSRVRGNTLQS